MHVLGDFVVTPKNLQVFLINRAYHLVSLEITRHGSSNRLLGPLFDFDISSKFDCAESP